MKMMLDAAVIRSRSAFGHKPWKRRAQDFDLLISDIGLPDRGGYELMRN
jgi:CheY-like chemotaxis protein